VAGKVKGILPQCGGFTRLLLFLMRVQSWTHAVFKRLSCCVAGHETGKTLTPGAAMCW